MKFIRIKSIVNTCNLPISEESLYETRYIVKKPYPNQAFCDIYDENKKIIYPSMLLSRFELIEYSIRELK
jgi:hypothetical protein